MEEARGGVAVREGRERELVSAPSPPPPPPPPARRGLCAGSRLLHGPGRENPSEALPHARAPPRARGRAQGAGISGRDAWAETKLASRTPPGKAPLDPGEAGPYPARRVTVSAPSSQDVQGRRRGTRGRRTAGGLEPTAGPASPRARPFTAPPKKGPETKRVQRLNRRLKSVDARLKKMSLMDRPMSAGCAATRPSTSPSRQRHAGTRGGGGRAGAAEPNSAPRLWTDMGKLVYHGVDPLRFNKEVRVRALQWIATEEEAFQEVVRAEYPLMVKKEVAALKQHLGNSMEGGSARLKSSTGISFDERVAKLAKHRVGRKIALEIEKRKLNEWNLPDVIRSISSEYLLAVRRQATKDGPNAARGSPVSDLDKIMPMDDAYRRSRRQKRKSVVQIFLENEERDRKAKAEITKGGGENDLDGVAPQRAARARHRYSNKGGAKVKAKPKPVILSAKLLEMRQNPDSHLRRAIRCGQWWELPINPREGESGAEIYARSCSDEEVRELSVLKKQFSDCGWDFHSLRLSLQDCSGIITVLQTSQHLTRLNFGGTTIGDEVGGMLISQLDLQNIPIVDLNMRGSSVGSDTCYALAAAFTRSQDFGVFKVVTGEGDVGESHIRKTLEHLDISGNALGEEGFINLLHSLHLVEQLRNLNVSRASLSNSVSMDICEYLKRTPKLEDFDISWNNFTEDGAAAVAMGMSENQSLKSLNASYMALGADGISELCLGTLQISDLCPGRFQTLDISGCNPQGEALMDLALMVHELEQYVEKFSLILRQVKLRGVAGQCLHRTLKNARKVKTDMDGCLYRSTMPELDVQPSSSPRKDGLQSPRRRSVKELEKAQWENTDTFTLDLSQWRDRSALEHLILHEQEALQKGGRSWKTVRINGVSVLEDGSVVAIMSEDCKKGEEVQYFTNEANTYRAIILPMLQGTGTFSLNDVPDNGEIVIEAVPLLWRVG